MRAGHEHTGWTAGQMHSLTSPIRTPPHGSTSYPHEGTAPTPPRRHKLTSLSPMRHGDTPAQHAPSPLFPPSDCSGCTRSVFAERDVPAAVPVPGRLDMPARAL
ncbi:Hypothetical predicted protein [Marmota monax]|uniref:Uncharacterized protein n=1 Tax=Marmota monax TaxID=9995 RepID=A0A5E4ATC0_MARMO|nr:Hypothetical predicted protein [Marmota monax]